MRKVLVTALMGLILGGSTAWVNAADDPYATYKRGDFSGALKQFMTLANKGDAMAQVWVASMYDKGEGVAKDGAEAAKWYRMAATRGNAHAQRQLGIHYFGGANIPTDYVEAERWFRLAALQGDSQAQFYLGALNAQGQGVPKNPVEAAKWFRLSAVQGNRSSQNIMGGLYGIGRGVPQDYVEALKWHQMAADQGDADSVREISKIRNIFAQQQGDQQRQLRQCDNVNSVLAEKRARLEKFKEINEARVAESRSDTFLGMNRAGLAALDPTSRTPWANVNSAVAADRAAKAQVEAEYQSRVDAMENEIDRIRISSGCN